MNKLKEEKEDIDLYCILYISRMKKENSKE